MARWLLVFRLSEVSAEDHEQQQESGATGHEQRRAAEEIGVSKNRGVEDFAGICGQIGEENTTLLHAASPNGNEPVAQRLPLPGANSDRANRTECVGEALDDADRLGGALAGLALGEQLRLPPHQAGVWNPALRFIGRAHFVQEARRSGGLRTHGAGGDVPLQIGVPEAGPRALDDAHFLFAVEWLGEVHCCAAPGASPWRRNRVASLDRARKSSPRTLCSLNPATWAISRWLEPST